MEFWDHLCWGGGMVPLWRSDRQNGYQTTAALLLSQLKRWTQEASCTYPAILSSKMPLDWIWICYLGDELLVFHLCTTCEMVISILIWCLSAVVCLKTSVARFYLDDERQLCGRPSLLRTVGSRVSCNRSLGKTLRCHAGWAMLPPASAYWLKYLLVVPLLTCNLPQQQQPGSPDSSSLELTAFYDDRSNPLLERSLSTQDKCKIAREVNTTLVLPRL